MTPKQFLETTVAPDITEFHSNYADLRCAFNAVAAVDALAAHLYYFAQSHSPQLISPFASDSAYRNELAKRDQSFSLIRDIAKAQKHVCLTRHAPQVKRADQIVSRPTGWGEGGWGRGRFGGPRQVVVEVESGKVEYLEGVLDRALELLKIEMTRLGINHN